MELHVTELTIEDHIAIVRLNRPARGNSWTNRMNAEYRWLMQSLEDNPDVRVIVVTGAGRQFCVGADFKALDHHKDSSKDYVESSSTKRWRGLAMASSRSLTMTWFGNGACPNQSSLPLMGPAQVSQ